MKQLTSYNRVAGYLNKLFDLLNQHFFENELARPTITIQSTPRAYGHFSLRDDAWVSTLGATHEINIGAGTLARPIEAICATLLHEMCHYYAHVHSIQDTSRGYTYHNKRFKQIAESHGLIVEHDPKYGWTITHPSEALLDFILENGLTDILITRNEHYGISVSGTGSHNGNPYTSDAEAIQQSQICLPLLRQFSEGYQACPYRLYGLSGGDGDSVLNSNDIFNQNPRKVRGLYLYAPATRNDF
ncbi:MAG: SprT-like domain-containing protein [Dysosmobacter sp.]